MPLRTPPSNISKALHQSFPGLAVQWDDLHRGWRFVHNGHPQAAILTHDDGVEMQELSADELIRLWHRGLVNRKEWLRNQAQRTANRQYRNATHSQKVREEAADEAERRVDSFLHPKSFSMSPT